MPDRCCVPECSSNYDKTDEYISVFKFPKDDTERKLWCSKIPRKDWTPSIRSVVCAKHFVESDIVRVDVVTDRNGSKLEIPRKNPKLKKGAYPSIFPNCPKYLSEKKPVPRKSRAEKIDEVDNFVYEKFLEEDKIKNFEDFCKLVEEKLSTFNNLKFYIVKNDDAIFLLNLNLSPIPCVDSSIRINNDMSLDVYYRNTCVNMFKFKSILNDSMLKRWSELENLLSMVKNMEESDSNESSSSEEEKSIEHWKKTINVNPEIEDKKKFILEQMLLCNKSKMSRRYSSDLLIFAYTLYMSSSSCYFLLYKSGLLTVPSMDHLYKMTHILKLDNSLSSSTIKDYMKNKCNILKDNDKVVSLLIDEIHVKKSIQYKGRTMTGFAENKAATEASTVQTFLVNSVHSSYKETLALVPVYNLNSKYLYNLVLKALHISEEAGLTILALISDNNRINRNMFKMLKEDHVKFSLQQGPSDQAHPINEKDLPEKLSFINNPANTSKKLFLLFDAVHLLKSIRNNWINQLDTEKTFCCPDFDDFTKNIKPKFSHLRKLYHWEKLSIVKMGHKLSFKCLYPSNIEKQDVKLAVSVFHESNDAALQLLGSRNVLQNWEDTVKFIQIIRKWWNIMNVSHLNKGHYLKCEDSKPFKELDDVRFSFLEKFNLWLHQWENMSQKHRNGGLTEETFFALSQTTTTVPKIIKELLSNGSEFVLTTKFQTDKLEKRFSEYRQMSGGNYHISVQQILESERKLKLKSILQLHSTMHGTVSLKTFVTEIVGNVKEPNANIDILPFTELINSDINLAEISQCDAEVLTYIAGYCANKIKVNCSACISFCRTEKELLVETCDGSLLDTVYVYIDIINRGGLKYPTENAIMCITVTYLLFQKMISEKYEKLFIEYDGKQYDLFTKITETFLKVNDISLINETCFQCNCPIECLIIPLVKSFINICLNNYVKNFSGKILEQKDERKVKKFKK